MVSIEVEVPEIEPLKITRVSGVDVGMRYESGRNRLTKQV
jgi:hypothetical protein